MYADRVTASMKAAMDETDRRREIQVDYNTKHGIDPQTIVKAIRDIGLRLRDVADVEGVNEKAKRPLAAGSLPKDELLRLIKDLEGQMKRAAKDLEFEKAALLRDEVVELRGLMVLEQGPESLEASAEPVGTTSRVIRAGGRRRRQGQ
jgi:excinuclease ABC subunit B